MSASSIEGIVSRLAEILASRQKELGELEHQRDLYEEEVNKELDRLADEERIKHARVRQIEECRRTLLDLQEEI